MTKRKPKTPVQVRFDAEQLAQLDALATRLDCKRSEVVRRGIPHLIRHLEAATVGEMLVQTMSGDEITLAWKNHVIELAAEAKCIPKCAREADVTQRTIRYHLEHDEVFRQLFNESRAYAVDDAEGALVELGKKGNVTALLAFLNAHHPDYGMIRTQVLQRVLGPFLDRIIRLAEEYVPAGLLNEFIGKICADAERVALESASGKR